MIKPLFIEDGQVKIVDQTKLPGDYIKITVKDHLEMAEAIKRLSIRGAPAIGIAAAYGLALGLKDYHNWSKMEFFSQLNEIAGFLNATRPTAMNLSWALTQMRNVAEKNKELTIEKIWQLLWEKAGEIHTDDINRCQKIGALGNTLVPEKAGILTHCNAGGLATGGLGTALGVIITAHKMGKTINVIVDETRPLLQGARLTSWELEQENIHHEICTDSAAGFLMQRKKVDMVIVGADRIAANGDAANKIGTYSLGVLAKYHKIPFYIAAPNSTIDKSIKSGENIPIEYRSELEVKYIQGYQLAPDKTRGITPAFDITPGHLISGIITEDRIYQYPYDFSDLK